MPQIIVLPHEELCPEGAALKQLLAHQFVTAY